MPDDIARRELDRLARSLPTFRHPTQLRAAIALPHWSQPGPPTGEASLATHLAERGVVRWGTRPTDRHCNHPPDTFAAAVFTSDPAASQTDWTAAHRLYGQLADRAVAALGVVPRPIRRRLGLDRQVNTREWTRVLFHLSWHFPNWMPTGPALYRWLPGEVEETILRFERREWPDRSEPYPGVLFSLFPDCLDLVSATEQAVELLAAALAALDPAPPPAGFLDLARAMHGQFLHASREAADRAGTPRPPLDAAVLHLAHSFMGSPAAEWAGVGATGWRRLQLSNSVEFQEHLCLTGVEAAELVRLAAQAGRGLRPAWAADQPAAVLDDLYSWEKAHTRRAEIDALVAANAPAGGRTASTVPLDWSATGRGLVTDDRTDAARWLGFVLATLMEWEPRERFEVTVHPPGHDALRPSWSATMRLLGMDLFAASARAIELAGWLGDQGFGTEVAARLTPAQKGGTDVPTDVVGMTEARRLADVPQPTPAAAPDGPCEPFSFRWKGEVREFQKGQRRLYNLLIVTWPMFATRGHARWDDLVADYERASGKAITIDSAENASRQLTTFLHISPGFPAKLMRDKQFLRWIDSP